ncbi:Membrane-bound inhibitor of C-type lysozyme [Sphingomonas laterariae]|uniref:Membrane-bound inhibitor of C-type lysozyme n=2 Tax=Edaphosphingomonas laterariae TaxID=861865 RepID=A0A239E9H6_9SPHN|nr:Membrane-bound inhibitor of C-type lysozyme [Sphingomonas laterariae]
MMAHGPAHTLPIALFALLAACGQSATPTPAESVTRESAAGDVAPVDARAPGANAAMPAAGAIREVGYSCTPAMAITARYDNSDATDPEVKLTIDGTAYDLDLTPSASGARYATDDGRADNRMLVWWTKGHEATLFEGKEGDRAEDEKTLATCTEKQTA